MSADADNPRGRVPEHVDEVDTGVLDMPDRLAARRKKSTSERIERLEQRGDEVTVSLVRIETKTDGQTKLIENIQKSVDRIASRDDVVFTSKVEFHKAEAIAKVEDEADKKRQRRERWTQILKGVIGGGAVLELLHRIGAL